jgi:ferric-dicitrate binding protein FerR (iron transport regulator)
VAITGEVYFEVVALQSEAGKRFGTGAKQPIPFLVEIVGKGLVEVLGTHFNINSYAGEKAIKTTLLEGSICFTANANPGLLKSGENKANPNSLLLTPGTQLTLAENGQIEVDQHADLERVLAWKNGYFMFSYDTLPEVMSQIARWYDVEVIFEGPISDRKFAGKMQRDLKLSEALKILENNHIQFKLEGRTLYVIR